MFKKPLAKISPFWAVLLCCVAVRRLAAAHLRRCSIRVVFLWWRHVDAHLACR